jgi:hypothetical protein
MSGTEATSKMVLGPMLARLVRLVNPIPTSSPLYRRRRPDQDPDRRFLRAPLVIIV